MKKAFFLLSITLALSIFQAAAQADNKNQRNSSWQKSTGIEFSSPSPLTLKPFDANSFRYNPNTLVAKENRQEKNLIPYNLEAKETQKYFPPRQRDQSQMSCYEPRENYSMPIYTPDSSIDYMLLVAKSPREF